VANHFQDGKRYTGRNVRTICAVCDTNAVRSITDTDPQANSAHDGQMDSHLKMFRTRLHKSIW